MKKRLVFTSILILLSPMFTFNANAAGKVDFLNVRGDTLFFGTDEVKTGDILECTYAESNNRWAVSLSTNSGQGIYSLLLTATANNLAVSVVSAGDCNDAPGMERPLSVVLSK